MKNIYSLTAILLTMVLCSNVSAQDIQLNDGVTQFSGNFKFCESTLPYKDKILVANFGSNLLNPLNQEGLGYISAIDKNGKISTFIPCDGTLSAPKGMAVVDNHLLISDVNKIVVYDLKKSGNRPQVVKFPEGELFVNDIVSVNNIILVTVTNTGSLYGIDGSDMSVIGAVEPRKLGSIPGANGIALRDNMLYIASYNPSEVPDSSNVIYSADIATETIELTKLIPGLKPSQYDGIAISQDGKTLYFTTWTGKNGHGNLMSYTLDSDSDALRSARVVELGVDLRGPADISIDSQGNIWVPDLVTSTVYRIETK